MNEVEAQTKLKSMLDFIRERGNDEINKLNKQAEEEFKAQKDQYIAEEKERVVQDYKTKL